MKIAKNTVVTVSYVVTDETDQVVGRTDPKQPVVALIGQEYLVPGMDKGLVGHEKGDEFTLKLKPEEAFGEFMDGLVQSIDRSMFGDFPIQVGNAFEADTSAGPRLVVIKEINDDKVVVDGNHPLAGKTLNFMIVVEDVREATDEEIAHGHAHENGVCPSEAHGGCCGGGGGCCGGGHGHGHGGGCGCHDPYEEEHECCGGGHGHGHGGCGCHDSAEEKEEQGGCCGGGHGHGHGGCGCHG